MIEILKRLAVIAICSAALTLHPQEAPQEAKPAPGSVNTTLKVQVNAVLVPVIVRDAQGHALGDLKQEDFKVFDQGKRRTLSGFSIEKGAAVEDGSLPVAAGTSAPVTGSPATPAATPASPTTNRYTVFLFDDKHMSLGDLVRAKAVGRRLLDQPLGDGDRAVVLSLLGISSGMTHDRTVLQEAIEKLKPSQSFRQDRSQCPDIDYYTADQLINKQSLSEWDVQVENAENCLHSTSPTYAEQLVRSAANQALVIGDEDARTTLAYVRGIVQTLSQLPGRRTIILISPGFLSDSTDAMTVQSQILDMAASANVTISALDTRGLTGGVVGASQTTAGSLYGNITGQPLQDQLQSVRANEVVMAELADGTGGTYFHNNNELESGLKDLANGPEYRYLLEISLQDVKPNGAYHALKVEVDRRDVKLQARHGYFAPSAANSRK